MIAQMTREVETMTDSDRPTAITAFAGFGLVDLALREAGFRVIGIEYDDQIAAVNRANGGECITADVCEVDPRQFLPLGPQLFHASPPCPNFSQAKAGAAETEQDIALARAVCRFIRTLKPRFVTLENVWLYRQSESWKMIRRCLIRTGYKVDFWRLCSADYGTPQTRHRMIVLARRDGVKPHKPFPTHSKTPDMFCQPWVGWYEAISDLIPGLPESKFAPWQLARLPGEIADHFIMSVGGNTNFNDAKPGNGARLAPEPYTSVMAQANVLPRAFVCEPRNASREMTVRDEDEPFITVQSGAFRRPASTPRAFIADGKLNGNAARLTARDGESPAFTVTTSHNNRDVKAFVVNTREMHDHRKTNKLTTRTADEPIFTVSSTAMPSRYKAVNGRVVSLTPRCLARFQDVPNWFRFPANRAWQKQTGQLFVDPADETPYNVDSELTCKGVGNGVPLNLMWAGLGALGLA